MLRPISCASCGAPFDPDARACPRCGVTARSRRCGVCFDMNLADNRNCRSCGRLLPKENPGAREEPLACSGCGAGMTPRRLEGASFDECDRCGGIWLTPSAVESVSREAETRALLRPFAPPGSGEQADFSRKVSYRRCPVCAKHMNRANYGRVSGVIVDTCREHGSHFDRGELTRIFEFIESGGLEQARRREAEESRALARDARREAISVGRMDPDLNSMIDPWPSGNGLELLGWIARALSSDR